MRTVLLVVAVAALMMVLAGASGSPQTDADMFALGRVALDSHHDCPAALRALEAVSQASRAQPLWALYMAKTHECLGHTNEAIEYYAQYDRAFPGQLQIVEKLANLRYKALKEADAERERAAAASVAARRTARKNEFAAAPIGTWDAYFNGSPHLSKDERRSEYSTGDFRIDIARQGEQLIGTVRWSLYEVPKVGEEVLRANCDAAGQCAGQLKVFRLGFQPSRANRDGDYLPGIYDKDYLLLEWRPTEREDQGLSNGRYVLLRDLPKDVAHALSRYFSKTAQQQAQAFAWWIPANFTVSVLDRPSEENLELWKWDWPCDSAMSSLRGTYKVTTLTLFKDDDQSQVRDGLFTFQTCVSF